MAKGNEYFLQKTINEIDIIMDYSKGMTVEDFKNQPAILDGIVFRMIQMSEHMNNISNDFKIAHSEIKWVNIKGFRNRLVHNYGNVDLDFVYNAISIDIPELKYSLTAILND